jgi:hypothetical protein
MRISAFVTSLAVAIIFVGAGIAVSDPNKECTSYDEYCLNIVCSKLSSTCTDISGQSTSFQYLQQAPELVGKCVTGTGECTVEPQIACRTWKYQGNPMTKCDLLVCTEHDMMDGCR